MSGNTLINAVKLWFPVALWLFFDYWLVAEAISPESHLYGQVFAAFLFFWALAGVIQEYKG